MEPSLQTSDTSLTITRVFRATPEEIWELWTDPEKISIWHRPAPTGFSTKAEGEAKVGGAYTIAMSHDGKTDTVHGIFQELEPPHKLVYSWQWEGAPTEDTSTVTVLLDPVPEGTKLTLVHDRLGSPQSVQAHAEGWLGCMVNMELLITK